jgi:thiamine pyrophosphate-dependent acetolactate synthase large subunit-like protein
LRTDLSDTLELHFFGQLNDCKDIFKPFQKFLGNKIFLHGLVDHTTTYQAMKEADFLINIGNANPYQLPSKVVEYACMGKPIINIIKVLTDSSANFLKSYPATFTILDDEQKTKLDIIMSLRQFIKNPPKIEDLMLKDWLRRFQTDSIASEYEKLLEVRNFKPHVADLPLPKVQ